MVEMLCDRREARRLVLEPVRNGLAQELLAQTALFTTEDYAEARAALRENRAPAYKGK